MVGMLNTVIGKVFLHPVTRVEYGQIRIPSIPTTFSTLDGTSYDALAEDGCGNYFTRTKDGAVWFWDHETDEFVSLAGSVAEFISHCTDPQPVDLDPDRVKSAWINPNFARSLGMKVPPDGWVKKPSKGK
jgi:hypothetical protein